LCLFIKKQAEKPHLFIVNNEKKEKELVKKGANEKVGWYCHLCLIAKI
jgi:hypothetical protein